VYGLARTPTVRKRVTFANRPPAVMEQQPSSINATLPHSTRRGLASKSGGATPSTGSLGLSTAFDSGDDMDTITSCSSEGDASSVASAPRLNPLPTPYPRTSDVEVIANERTEPIPNVQSPHIGLPKTQSLSAQTSGIVSVKDQQNQHETLHAKREPSSHSSSSAPRMKPTQNASNVDKQTTVGDSDDESGREAAYSRRGKPSSTYKTVGTTMPGVKRPPLPKHPSLNTARSLLEDIAAKRALDNAVEPDQNENTLNAGVQEPPEAMYKPAYIIRDDPLIGRSRRYLRYKSGVIMPAERTTRCPPSLGCSYLARGIRQCHFTSVYKRVRGLVYKFHLDLEDLNKRRQNHWRPLAENCVAFFQRMRRDLGHDDFKNGWQKGRYQKFLGDAHRPAPDTLRYMFEMILPFMKRGAVFADEARNEMCKVCFPHQISVCQSTSLTCVCFADFDGIRRSLGSRADGSRGSCGRASSI
jgi:hypothetical protein